MALPKQPGGFPTCVYPREGAPFLVTTPAEYAALDPEQVADHPNYWLGWREGFDQIRAAQTPAYANTTSTAVHDLTGERQTLVVAPMPSLPANEAPARRGPGRPRKDA